MSEHGWETGNSVAFQEGFEEGDRRGWNEAIEAAAKWLESQEGHGGYNRFVYAAAIRKLGRSLDANEQIE